MAGWVGRTVGKVSLELLLSRGVIADTFLGRDMSLQRAVTVKLLHSTYAEDPGLQDRFKREARALTGLRHENIQPVLDFESVDGRPYLVAEHIPGIYLDGHLRALAAAGKKLERREAAAIIFSIGDALQYAHDRGILHGDLSPQHILLTSPSSPLQAGKDLPHDLRVVVADFGLAQIAQAVQSPSSTQVARARAYMSPERLSGSASDQRSDLFSFGVIAHELILGRVPSDVGTVGVVQASDASEGQELWPDVPAALRETIQRALSPDPARRFQSASEMAAELRAALAVAPDPAPVAPRPELAGVEDSAGTRPPRNLRAWLSTAVVGAAVLALAGVLGSRFLLSPDSPPGEPVPDAPGAATSEPSGPAVGDPVGVLRFQDGAASVDEVSFNATGMPPALSGNQYEIWLIDESGEERRSVGYLTLDAEGSGIASFVDGEGRNLLAAYSGLEITVEPVPDSNPNPAATVAFTTQLPADGLLHVRHILVSFGRAPEGSALLRGLVTDAELANTSAKSMLSLYESGDELGTRSAAEATLNLLLGSQSPEYSDWDGDGQIEDLGDGYGLLLNGDQSGYIQGSLAHAEFAASSADATEQMQSHGEHVIVSARNLEEWAAQLRSLLEQIVASPFDPAMGGLIRQAVALTDTMLLGTDLNGNERVEAIAGEGGAQTAYQHALYMADMVVTLQE